MTARETPAVVFLQASSGARGKCVNNSEQASAAITRVTPLSLKCSHSGVQAWQVTAHLSAAAQQGGREQSTKPRRMLQRLNRVPCFKRHRRGEYWRQVTCALHTVSPLLQLFVFIPVGIVDDRIARSCGRQQILASRNRGVEGGEFISKVEVVSFRLKQVAIIAVVGFASSAALPRRRTPSQHIEPISRQRPSRVGLEDAPTGAQDGVGARDFVGRRPNVHALVVENQVFDVDEFAGEPQTVAGIREMGPRDPAVPNRAAGQPFVEPSDGVFGRRKRRCRF